MFGAKRWEGPPVGPASPAECASFSKQTAGHRGSGYADASQLDGLDVQFF